jgi:hypothetical protein
VSAAIGCRTVARRLAGAAVALALAVGSAGAQTLRVGDRVRVWVPTLQAEGVTGTITRIDGDRIELAGTSYGDAWGFSAGALSRAELSLGAGDRGREIRRGLLIGGLAGFVAGLGFALGTSCQGDDDICKLQTSELVSGVVVGTSVGALGGALVGVLRAREDWVRLELPVQVSLAPTGCGWTLAVALPW